MSEKSKEDLDLLAEMKGNVKRWFEWFSDNFEDYKEMMLLIYKSSVSESDRSILESINKPAVEINYLNAYLNRLIGEFSHQTPAVSVSGSDSISPSNPLQPFVVDVVEGNLMKILDHYDKYSKNTVIKQQCGGGFSVLKTWTEYRNSENFDQDLYVGDCEPLRCFFDVFAKTPSKADGDFSGEVYPMPEKEFKRKYPKYADEIKGKYSSAQDGDFQWYFDDGRSKVIMLCDYYCKKYKNKELVYLADGSSMSRKEYNELKKSWSSIEPIPEITNRRIVEDYDIYRYIFFGDNIIKKEKLKYPKLPYFFVDGNSGPVYCGKSQQKKQKTQSYLKNGVGPQKLLNHSAQTIADGMQNLMRSKMLIEKRAIVDPESWQNIHRVSHLQWNSTDKNGEQLPKPEPIVQPDIPSSVFSTFSSMQNTMQNSMGSYDAQLGISDQQLSGVAIEKGATQNNAVSIPYAQNYMLSLTDAIDFCVKMMPSLYVTGATVPVMDKEGNHGYIKVNQIAEDGSFDINYPVINYRKNDLNVHVKSDYSFALQKERAIQTMISMMNASEGFKALMESPEGISAFLDNLDMRSLDKIKQAHEKMLQQAQQQPPQPSPMEVQAQLKQQELMLEQQELQQKQQKDMMDAKLKQAELELERQKMQQQAMMEILEMQESQVSNAVAHERVAAEIETHQVDNAVKLAEQSMKEQQQELKLAEQIMKHADQQHRHTMDVAKHQLKP